MVEFSHVRWEKRNRTNFSWGVVEVWVSSIQYGGIETFWDRKLCINFLVWAWFFLSKWFKIYKSIYHNDLI